MHLFSYDRAPDVASALAEVRANPNIALLAGGTTQLDLMKRPRYREPYYWAAFQLQGEWR